MWKKITQSFVLAICDTLFFLSNAGTHQIDIALSISSGTKVTGSP